MDNDILVLAQQVVTLSKERGIRIVTAESCTGGMVAAALTEIPGSSEVLERGFVTYSNLSKQQMLGVPAIQIEKHGAVSAEVALAMAEGALISSAATLSISLTGIAGPSGGSEAKPVGTVFIASAMKGKNTLVQRHLFSGNRQEIRNAACKEALTILIRQLQG